ncbi:MAG: hypothetical protein AAF334_05665 [Pseudomonadota bacterium]
MSTHAPTREICDPGYAGCIPGLDMAPRIALGAAAAVVIAKAVMVTTARWTAKLAAHPSPDVAAAPGRGALLSGAESGAVRLPDARRIAMADLARPRDFARHRHLARPSDGRHAQRGDHRERRNKLFGTDRDNTAAFARLLEQK